MQRLAFGIFIALAGCGGGGGSDAGRSPTASASPAAVVTTTAVAAAPAPETRPYVVIGRCFQCDGRLGAAGAAMLIDGEPVGQALPLQGVVAVARGTTRIDPAGGVFRQSYAPFASIDARSAVVGAVEWIDRPRGRIGVLGQEVQGMDSWVGGEEPHPYGLDVGIYSATLRVGDRIRVDGFDTADGIVLGIALHSAPERSADRVTGAVGRLDSSLRRLGIGALDVDYGAASVEEFPSGEIHLQDRVEVVGTLVSPRLLRATSVRLQESPLTLAAGTEVAVVGRLRRVTGRSNPSGRDFAEVRILGQVLRVAADCDGARSLRDGDVAYVHGQVKDDGLISSIDGVGVPDIGCRASRTTLGGEFTITTTVETLDLVRSSLSAFGIPVQAQSATQLSDESGSRLELSEFGPGTRIRVVASGGTPPVAAIATSIERVTDAPVAGAKLDAFMRAEGVEHLLFRGRRIVIDATTTAGLRADCSGPFNPGTPIDPFRFVPAVFTRNSSLQRYVEAEVHAAPDGSWVAVRVEAYNDPYCD